MCQVVRCVAVEEDGKQPGSDQQADDGDDEQGLARVGIDVAALVLSELVCIQGIGDREGHDIHDRIPSDGKERNHIGIEP